MDNYEDIEDETLEDEDEIDRGDLVEDEDLEDEEEGDEDNDSDEDQDEEDSDDDDEESDESEDEDSDEDPKQNIPLSRLNEVISQRDEKTDRIEWLESQLESLINQSTKPEVKEITPEPTYDFTEAEESYANLLIEGETGKAAALRANIEDQPLDVALGDNEDFLIQ